MADIATVPSRRHSPLHRFALVAVLVVAFIATMAAEANATVRFEHHTDPAGDMTLFTYNLVRPSGEVKNTTQLNSDDWNTSFGPGPGVWTLQAVPLAGWRVVAIRCTTTDEEAPGQESQAGILNVDVANGRVTIDHAQPGAVTTDNHHVCAFTHARIGATPSGGSAGVAPTPVRAGNAAVRPTRTEVSRVAGGRRAATATVRLARRATIRATLLNGRRVVGSRRLVRAAGQHRLTVKVKRAELRRLRARGRTRATLRMRVVLAEQGGRAQVFNIRVRVRLT